MGKLRDDLLAFEERMGELVEAVAIARARERGDFEPHGPVMPVGRDEAMAQLDREYDGGMGSRARLVPIYAWTRSWVLFLSGEEGGAGPAWVPRHPVACAPEINGSDELSGNHTGVLAMADEVFGSREQAERWLRAPAIALDGRRPIDLLSTPAGVAQVEQLLGRIEYGVYT